MDAGDAGALAVEKYGKTLKRLAGTRIGFTGTQRGLSALQSQFLLNFPQAKKDIIEFHHGDCIGADAQAHDIFAAAGIRIIVHPPENPSKRAFKFPKGGDNFLRGPDWWPVKPYLQRNHDIVDNCDLLIACPHGAETRRSGTWATVRYAIRMHKPVWVIMPNGAVTNR